MQRLLQKMSADGQQTQGTRMARARTTRAFRSNTHYLSAEPRGIRKDGRQERALKQFIFSRLIYKSKRGVGFVHPRLFSSSVEHA